MDLDSLSDTPMMSLMSKGLDDLLKDRLFEKCRELIERLGCSVFVIISEDGISSQYIGSPDFVREFNGRGLKMTPCDVEIKDFTDSDLEHLMKLEVSKQKNQKNRGHGIKTKNNKKRRVMCNDISTYSRLFMLCQELMEKLGWMVFVICSEDGISSLYTGSENLVREYKERGLKMTPCDVEIKIIGDSHFEVPEDVREFCIRDAKQKKSNALSVKMRKSGCLSDLPSSRVSTERKFDKRYNVSVKSTSEDILQSHKGGEKDDDVINMADDTNQSEGGIVEERIGQSNSDDVINMADDDNQSEDTCGSERIYHTNDADFVNSSDKINKLFANKFYSLDDEEQEDEEMKRKLDIHKEKVRKAVTLIQENKPFICQKCGFGYRNQRGLDFHSAGGVCASRKCQFCKMKVLFKDYPSHITEEHAMRVKLKPCRLCDRSFLRHHERQEHVRRVHMKLELKCDVCMKVWKTERGFRDHQLRHQEISFKCRLCPTMFTTESQREKHEEKHTTASGFSRTCQICDKTFKGRRSFRSHIEKYHTEREYKCTYCNKRYMERHLLRKHLETHGELRSVYTCKFCNKTFNIYTKYALHLKNVCRRIQRLCEVCGRSFSRKDYLTTHMKSHGVPRYKCEHCPREFKLRSTLRSHVRSAHSDSRPWQCEICGYRCKLKENLSKHMKKHK